MNQVDIEMAKQLSTSIDHKVQTLLKGDINNNVDAMVALSNEMCAAVARAQAWLNTYTAEIEHCSTVYRIAKRLHANLAMLRDVLLQLESHIDDLKEDLENPTLAYCYECNRFMSDDEIGDEFPEERVCETCVSK